MVTWWVVPCLVIPCEHTVETNLYVLTLCVCMCVCCYCHSISLQHSAARHILLVSPLTCRYASVHESACMPYAEGQKRELTSEEVNAELARWKPTHDYGTDSVFSITPPVVKPQDMAIYEKSCRVAEKGPVFQTTEYRLYSKYISKWSSNVC